MTTHAWVLLHVQNIDAQADFYWKLPGWTCGERPTHDTLFILDPDGDVMLLAGPEAGDVTPYLEEKHLVKHPGDLVRVGCNDIIALHVQIEQEDLQDVELLETAWNQEIHVPAPDGYTVCFVGPSHLSAEEWLTLYEQGPDKLEALLADLHPGDLDFERVPGEWTIRQIVHHIADGENIWAMLVKAALVAPGCTCDYQWYNADNSCAIPLDYAGRDIEPAVALFRALRAHTTQLLRHLPNQWENAVLFKRIDMTKAHPVTIAYAVQAMTRHAVDHIEDIQRILQQRNSVERNGS